MQIITENSKTILRHNWNIIIEYTSSFTRDILTSLDSAEHKYNKISKKITNEILKLLRNEKGYNVSPG